MSPTSRILVGIIGMASTGLVHAHRMDEYLQSSLVAVDERRIGVEVALTPGAELADWILPMIDADRDALVSAVEAAAYAERVRTNLVLTVDATALPLRLEAWTLPEMAEMKEGSGVIRLRFETDATRFEAGIHRLRFQNAYLTNHSVYQANALVSESPRIILGRQERDVLQTRLEFGFTVVSAKPENQAVAKGSILRRLAVLVLGAGAALWVWTGFRRVGRAG